MVRRTKDEALATRHAILDAAALLFQQRGVSRTSLQDIAVAAQVTRGAIYWHFNDKADLFNALLERATLPFEEAGFACGAGCPDDRDPVRFLLERLTRVLKLIVEHEPTRCVFEIATHKVEYVDELLSVRDRHRQTRDRCLADIEADLKLGMKLGLIGKRVPARAAAIGLHALIDGLIQNWMLDNEAFDLVRVGRQVAQTYLAGLRTDTVAVGAS